jgi:hypothetical protein
VPLVAFSIRLDRIDESLLFEAKDGSSWLSCVCTYEEDTKGRLIVAQSIPKERFAAGEKGPHIGIWREIGTGNRKSSEPVKKFDLSKYKNNPAKPQQPQAEERLFPEDDAPQNDRGPI